MRRFLLLLPLAFALAACDSGGPEAGPVTFVFTQSATGPSTFAGTFTLSGTYADSGTTTDALTVTSAQGENPLRATFRREVVGREGTLVLVGDAAVDLADPAAARVTGTWRVQSATGEYADLTGSGTVAGTADFTAQPPHGTVRYTGELRAR